MRGAGARGHVGQPAVNAPVNALVNTPVNVLVKALVNVLVNAPVNALANMFGCLHGHL